MERMFSTDRRCWLVSGRRKNAAISTIEVTAAMKAKLPRQPTVSAITPPRVGPISGATTMAAVTLPSMDTALSRPYTSWTMARASTRPEVPPAACRMRPITAVVISCAVAPTRLPTIARASAPSSTGRRP